MEPRDRTAWHRASLRACERKEQHPTWSAARRACVRAKRDGWDHMEPYRCPGCAKYHAGHPADREREQEGMSPYVVVTVDHQPGGPTKYGIALTTNGIDRQVVVKPSLTVKEAHRRAREVERRIAQENN